MSGNLPNDGRTQGMNMRVIPKRQPVLHHQQQQHQQQHHHMQLPPQQPIPPPHHSQPPHHSIPPPPQQQHQQPPPPPLPQQQQQQQPQSHHHSHHYHHGHHHHHVSSSLRSVSDLKKLVEDFLTKIECGLYAPYDVAHAQNDYESILLAISYIHKNLNDKDMLNVGPNDRLDLSGINPKVKGVGEEDTKLKMQAKFRTLFHNAVNEKTIVDSKFEKIAAAAAAAKARLEEE